MPNKKTLESVLLDNPSLSSDWITAAIPLIKEYNMDKKDLKKYNTSQLKQLSEVFKASQSNEKIKVDLFLNPLLNETQMQILLVALSKDIPFEKLEKYFNPEIPYIITNWIVSGYVDGFDLDKYYENGFDKDQLAELYSAMKDGVDVTLYDRKDISAEVMSICRHALNLGLSIKFNKNNELIISTL